MMMTMMTFAINCEHVGSAIDITSTSVAFVPSMECLSFC